MPPYPAYTSSHSPPHARFHNHSPTKSSPLRHALSTRSNGSESSASLIAAQNSTIGHVASTYTRNDKDLEDPFIITRTSSKRDRSESPVKKSAAFAKWEQREQAEQERSHSPRAGQIDPGNKKTRDDGWRGAVITHETRNALQPVALNTRSEPMIIQKTAKSEVYAQQENVQSSLEEATRLPDMVYPHQLTPQSEDKYANATNMRASPTLRSPQMNPISPSRKNGTSLSRSDSMRASTRPRERGHIRFQSTEHAIPQLDNDDIACLQKSSTPQLRHLSKLASESGTEELSVHTPEEQVAGLAGRRRLQRADSVRTHKRQQSEFASQYASTRWMDTQRKHLQAYEYLCHIGEARAWLQDVLQPIELAPIVQLEEALRDGVTLAEAVVCLAPALPSTQQAALGSLRIFRNPRLQYRHSDNIALFFRFLAEVELPELFRFELVDLYEKKNVPKVIYCIHALSWLLYRKGVVEFRIGNLLGQLQFEDHELEETQRGIERSGVQMPNFGGMREAMQIEVEEPPPEPTADELLAEQYDVIVDLQAQMRGAMTRGRLFHTMQQLWDVEHHIAGFQALARGSFARQIFEFKHIMHHSTCHLQAAAKAFLVRKQQQQRHMAWQENFPAVVTIQSLWRGRRQRIETATIQRQLQSHRHGIKQLQSAIRGVLGRWRADDVWQETQDTANEVQGFQALIRGALARRRVSDTMNALWATEDTIVELQALLRSARVCARHKQRQARIQTASINVHRLQAAARGLIHRRQQNREHGSFESHISSVVHLQASARGLVQRRRQSQIATALNTCHPCIRSLQALARGGICRIKDAMLRRDLVAQADRIVQLQSLSRAALERTRIGVQLGSLEDKELAIQTLQSIVRASLERQRVFGQLMELRNHEHATMQLQALCRAMIVRCDIGNTLMNLEDQEDAMIDFQAACRASLVRIRFAEKQRHYRENMAKVIKLQSFVRGKQQGESYKSLVTGKNPPLPVVRRHLHLLTDTNLEFESELEAERLRKQVADSVHRNELVEGYLEKLDVKIALLVKNKITLDEVVKHQKQYGGSASQLLRGASSINSHSAGFDLKALNKSSRKKLSQYEELFFYLQNQPGYLARLLQELSLSGLPDKESKSVVKLIMALFGNAQKSREEYLFLRVLSTSIEGLLLAAETPDDFARLSNGAFGQRLLTEYIRNPRERAYLKVLLGGIIRNEICAKENMDLESDPAQIYRAILNHEELSTGQPSRRPKNITRELAIRENDVRQTYVEHLQDLRDLCDLFFIALEDTLPRMPYGIRFILMRQYNVLESRFKEIDQAHLTTMVGHWFWKTYLLPALKEPEFWGIIDRGLQPIHKRNLAQVITVVGQVVSGRKFGPENLYFHPLNNWIEQSIDRWHHYLHRSVDLASPEEYFNTDEYSDHYSRSKPTLTIKLTELFSIHTLIHDHLPAIAPGRDTMIKPLMTDLGTAKNNESDFMVASNGSEITLTLKPKHQQTDDPYAEARSLFTATKRLVLYVIKVQSGSNLMEILIRPITRDDADRWIEVIEEEQAESQQDIRRARRPVGALDSHMSIRGGRAQSVYSEAPSAFSEDRRDVFDLANMTYADLKRMALENILKLEKSETPAQFRVSRHNHYQEILNALAADIRQKHRRRLDRQQETDSTLATLSQLDSKARFLDDQLKSYNDYIEQCMTTLASKKGSKHKFVMPFSKQWSHVRELEKTGRQPKFGSYKYSARQLADKGVLLSWDGFPHDQWGQLNVVISSDAVGVFNLEASAGSMLLPGGHSNLLLEDLLAAQFDNKDSIALFEASGQGGARLAVNLLLHLVFKKFYRDD